MLNQRSSAYSWLYLTHLRRSSWFACVLLVAVVCTVGLYCVRSCPGHETLAADLGCPVCHAVAHSALQVYAPEFEPRPVTRRIHLIARTPVHCKIPGQIFHIRYEPRAPPFA